MPVLPPAELADFIRRLPKTETHLHIEGALPWELLQKLDPERFRRDPPWWAEDYRYDSFESFERLLIEHALLWFTSAERYHEAAATVFRRLLGEGARYVETSFHLGILELLPVSGPQIVEAIRSAAPPGLEVRVFVGMLRNHHTARGGPLIAELTRWPGLAGIDLHGVEWWDLEPWTPPVWAAARAAGLETKAHAGEFGGPENVRQALEVLGVRRVQHGVRAVEDPAVVALLRERGATCDVCPISNVRLRVAPSLREHPIRRLFDAGVRCTISTDDPFSFGNTLLDEYASLAGSLDFSARELARLARNGFSVAQVPLERRRRWQAEVEAVRLEHRRSTGHPDRHEAGDPALGPLDRRLAEQVDGAVAGHSEAADRFAALLDEHDQRLGWPIG